MGGGGSKGKEKRSPKTDGNGDQSQKQPPKDPHAELKDQIKDLMLKEGEPPNAPWMERKGGSRIAGTAQEPVHDERRWQRARETGALSLAHKEISMFPEEVLQLSNLTSLDLSANNLEIILPNIETLSQLKTLDLGCNDLKTLPKMLLPALEHLNVSHNQFDEFPDVILRHTTLRKLEIHHNVLQIVPALTGLGRLQTICIASNQIQVGPELGSEVREYDASQNRIVSLPSLARCVALQHVDLSFNCLSAFPEGLVAAQQLSYLDLSSNMVLSVPQLTSLPEAITTFSCLRELYIKDNQIAGLPANIGALRSLVKLDASHNLIPSIPPSISALTLLNTLNLSHNPINSAAEIGAPMLALRDLLLGSTGLKDVPLRLSELTNLRALFLGYNKLTTFPLSALVPLSNLMQLCLAGNKLTSMPADGVTNWDCPIRELYLAENAFTRPPEILDHIRYIRILDLKVLNSYWVDLSHCRIDSAFWDRLRDERRRDYSKEERKAEEEHEKSPDYDPHNYRPFLRRDSKKPPTRYEFGITDTIGKREYMEDDLLVFFGQDAKKRDVSVFGVLDGHGGRGTVNTIRRHYVQILLEELEKSLPEIAIRNSFLEMNRFLEKLRSKQTGETDDSGATVCVVIIIDNVIYSANVGDARAVMCRGGEAVRLSRDHKPLVWDEEQRIRNLGGFVTLDGRVMGRLAVSRAMGDLEMAPFISCDPFIYPWKITPKDEFIVIACDGVWDVITDRMAVQLVQPHISCPEYAATKLRDHALFYGSTDNISAIVINLQSSAKGAATTKTRRTKNSL